MGEVEKRDGGKGRNQKYDVEPSVIKVELKVSENVGDNHSAIDSWRYVSTVGDDMYQQGPT